MNCRHGLLVVVMGMVAAWCSPMVAFSQVPTFGRLDAVEGMPKCLHEVNPGVYVAGELVLSNTPYFVWVADKKVGRTHEQASWRRFGPWTLEGGKRYVFVSGSIVGNTRATNVTVSPGLASLHFENRGSVPTWITVNPLPPGCGPNIAGNSKWDQLIGGTQWIVNRHPVPWVFHAGGVVEAPGLWKGQWVGQEDRIEITLAANGVRDIFWVVFDDRMESFTAYKDGQVYRQGVRKSDVPPTPPPSSDLGNMRPDGVWTAFCGVGNCDGGKHLVTVTTDGERFRATASYTNHGKPHSWVMTGTISRTGKVHAKYVHSNHTSLPDVEFQLSSDGKTFSGGGWHLVRN